jgi:hypothetical protein
MTLKRRDVLFMDSPHGGYERILASLPSWPNEKNVLFARAATRKKLTKVKGDEISRSPVHLGSEKHCQQSDTI